VENGKGRKSRLGGSPARGEPTRPAGKPYVANDDARDGGINSNGQGVLRQPEQLEQVSVRPSDPSKQRSSRPNIIQAQPYETKSGGFTLLRHRHARAAKAIENGKVKQAEIGLPVSATTEIIERLDSERKWARMVLESIEDFEAIMANPEWLINDKAGRIEMIIGTMHSRITNLKKTIE